ncbi:MAG TPA: hypothetical protein VG125_32020, partial [Pirellulales bacterium]|nr:hypothetical protein [Pirellulales bacterium]
AAIAYALTRGDKLPADVVASNATPNRVNTAFPAPAIPDQPASPKAEESSKGPAPSVRPPAQASSPAELTPQVPETAALLTLGELGLPVDVLKAIDLDRDRVHGDWQYDGQALVSPADDIQARLQLPAIISGSYQLDLVAQRESGNEGLILTVPVAGTQGTLVMDDYAGKLSGLQMIDGQKVEANETKHEGPIFADGKRHLVRVTVQKNHVRLVCDGKSIVDWTGDLSRLKPSESLPHSDRVYLASWQSRYRLTQIKLRPLRDDTPEESTPAVAGEPIDLLKQIDVKRDAVSGEWSLTNDILTSPAAEFACLALPSPPAPEYRLTVDLQRIEGVDTFSVGLPIGNHHVIAAVDAWDGKFSGLEKIDEKSCYDNESARAGHLLEPGRRYTLAYTVRAKQVKVEVDGLAVIDWTGDPARLSTIPVFKSSDPTRLVLGTAHGSVFHISKLEIQPLTSRSAPPRTLAPLVEPSPPKVEPDRKFADLASNKETRLQVPDDEAQKEARKEVQKKLASSLKGAKTPEQKRSLARELAQKAVVDDKTGANAYVLLKQAIDLAEAAGEIELAWQTVDQLAKTFAVDGMALRSQSLAEIGKAAKSSDAAWQLTDTACRLMTTALLASDAAAVKKAGLQAQSFAKRTGDRALQKDVNGRATDAGKLAAELEAVTAAREKLKTAPDDPQANFTLGHFELCAAGDFEAALPKLAKGSDEGWKKLATDELALDNRQGRTRVFANGRRIIVTEGAEAERALTVADAWWSRADDAPWPGKHHLRMRAARWYGSAYRSLVDAGRVRAAERLRMLLATDDGFPRWELFNWFGSGEPNGEVLRLEGGRGGLQTAVEYTGALDVTVVARTTGTEFGLGSHNWSWGWKFKLVPNQWHTLRFVINPVSRTAFVDGVPLDTDAWETPRKFNAAPVSVYVNNDEIVEIRRFIVRATD